jgi:hypothetical protein
MDPTDLGEDFVLEVEHLTNEIAALLSAHPAQAEVMRSLGEAARQRPETLGTLCRAGGIWGGSGSVTDVELGDKRADKQKRQLEVRLVECFERAGYVFERASQTAAIYRGWLKRGVLG